jgi:hypothetical protein
MPPITIYLLPDGSGRVRIHYFHRDDKGPVSTAQVVHPTQIGPVPLGGATGFIACQPGLKSLFTPAGPVVHSDDPRAVTCPECRGSGEWREVMTRLGEPVPEEKRPGPEPGPAPQGEQQEV